MPRTANPDKAAIDELRNTAKEHVKAIKGATSAKKKLASVNAKLAKFGAAPVADPDGDAAPAKPAPKAKATKETEKPAKKGAPVKAEKSKTGKVAKAATKSVTMAPKRGRPPKAKNDDLSFDD